MVSQIDVAKASGVSPATASLALNNHPRVSAKTTLLVQRVAKRMGYVPNHAARQLIRSRFGPSLHTGLQQIGMANFCSLTDAGALKPTDMAFVNGVEHGVAAHSGFLVYIRHTDDLSSRRIADLTRAGTVEGWIVFSHVDDARVSLLDRLGRPWVALGDHTCSRPLHQANLDFRMMGKLAVRHLADLGHRRIGFIGSRMHFNYPQEILIGYREAMREAGLDVFPETVLLRQQGADPRPWLAEVLPSALRHCAAPTAFVYCEPGESEAMLSACAAQGARVPEDIGFVFCEISDSLPITHNSSRIEASAVEAGRAAVALLMDVAMQENPAPRNTLVAPRIVEGKTAGKANR